MKKAIAPALSKLNLRLGILVSIFSAHSSLSRGTMGLGHGKMATQTNEDKHMWCLSSSTPSLPPSTSRTCSQCAAGWHSPPSTFFLACRTSDFGLGPPGKRMPAPSPAGGGLGAKPKTNSGGRGAVGCL